MLLEENVTCSCIAHTQADKGHLEKRNCTVEICRWTIHLYIAYLPDKVIKKESPPHSPKHKTYNATQHNMGAAAWVPNLYMQGAPEH